VLAQTVRKKRPYLKFSCLRQLPIKGMVQPQIKTLLQPYMMKTLKKRYLFFTTTLYTRHTSLLFSTKARPPSSTAITILTVLGKTDRKCCVSKNKEFDVTSYKRNKKRKTLKYNILTEKEKKESFLYVLFVFVFLEKSVKFSRFDK